MLETSLLPPRDQVRSSRRSQHPVERRFVRLAAGANKRARKFGVPGYLVAADLLAAYEAQDGQCAYCPVGLDPMHCSFDHGVALSRGGHNTRANLVACCTNCQRTKGRKDPEEFEDSRALGNRACDVCGRSYQPRWSDWKRGKGRTCSASCAGVLGGRKAGRGRETIQ